MKNLSHYGLTLMIALAISNAAYADNFDSLDIATAEAAGLNTPSSAGAIGSTGAQSELGDNFNLDTLNIDGQYTDKQPSAADLLRKKRSKLERDNELLARKQIEKMRYQQEMEMAKKLQKVFDDSLKKIESIN